jgi:DNA ligase-1
MIFHLVNRSRLINRCYALITVLILAIQIIPAYAVEPPPLQLANVYHENIDLRAYWVSEKLDGVRAYWDGQQLASRQGNIIHAPSWFTANFPSEALDGELWIGRSQFELVSGIVRQKQPDDAKWRQVRFMVFDMPKNPDVFTQRLAAMEKVVAVSQSPYLQLVKQYRIANHQQLMAQLQVVVKAGGEGLMLHRGDSLYQAARNDDLLKVKAFQDAEAIVIAYVPGQGKYQGMMGALLVENSDKIRFKIGSGFSDAQRKNPPGIGSVITYKYFGKGKNNVPRFASFLRVRQDINAHSINNPVAEAASG